MGLALDAGLDLGALAGCYVCIAFLEVLVLTLTVVVGVFDVAIFGAHPFRFIGDAITNTAIKWANDALRGVERVAAKFQTGLLESLYLLVGIPLLLAVVLKDVLEYMWNEALRPVIHSVTDAIKATADDALSESVGVAQGLATGLGTLEYEIGTLRRDVGRDISAATNDLRGVLEGELGRGIDDVRGIALSAVDDLRRAEQAAIDAVAGTAGATLGELHDFEQRIPFTDIAGLIAAVPLLSALVQTLEAETGLDRAECRTKVKQICSTDPSVWGNLLAGLALIGFGFGFADLVEAAGHMVGAEAALLGELANVSQDAIDAAGQAVGEITLSIAA